MMKPFFWVVFLFSIQIQSQEIKVKIDSKSKKYTWGMLYKYEEGMPVYLANATGKRNKFAFTFEQPLPNGVYRFVYALTENAFVDFFYDGKDVSFVFHPRYPKETLQFKKSVINTSFVDFQNKNQQYQNQLDSIQGLYFRRAYPSLKSAYKDKRKQYEQFFTHAQKTAQDQLLPFINASQRTFASSPFPSPKAYVADLEQHLFNEITINKKAVLNSSFLNDKVLATVFDLYVSRNPVKQDSLYRVAIEKFFLKVKTPQAQRKYTKLILNELKEVGTLKSMHWVLDTYYKTIPAAWQDSNYLEQLTDALSLAIGADAPDIVWTESEEEISMKKTFEDQSILLVFWSAECSHCREEIPKVYQQTNKIPNLKVLAIGVEERAKFWDTDHKTFPKWKHLLGLDKWQNEWAQTYEVESTPTYILIDDKGKIKAKPNDFNALNLALRSIQ